MAVAEQLQAILVDLVALAVVADLVLLVALELLVKGETVVMVLQLDKTVKAAAVEQVPLVLTEQTAAVVMVALAFLPQ